LWHRETQLPTRTAQQKDHAQDAQKGQASHPPSPGAPRRAFPQARPQRTITLLRGAWDDPSCARHSHPPTHWHAETCHLPWRGPSDFLPFLEEVAEAALYCAHRTSIVSPCAFCEQEGHLAAPSSFFSSRALREHRDRPSYPISLFSILLCSLRLSRACDTVLSLHLERGKRLWPQNRKKDLSFGIGGAGVAQTVLPPLRLPHRGSSPTSRLHPLIHTRTREFPSPFPLSSSLWAAPH
jgi:hypothetical protein